MRKVKVENTKPIPARKDGGYITVQIVDDSILVLNIYNNKILKARHCINILTKEYATLKGCIWSVSKIETALDIQDHYSYYYYSHRWGETLKKKARMSEKDEQTIRDLFETDMPAYASGKHIVELISRLETEYQREKREITEMNRIQKVKETMDKVPDVPYGIKEWINQRELGGQDYMLKDRETGLWTCSSCGKESKEEQIKTESKSKPRNNDTVICPKCKKKIQILTRKKYVDVVTHFAMVQQIDDEMSVIRHFKAEIFCEPKKRKAIGIEEEIRIIMYKDAQGFSKGNAFSQKRICSIYYEQYNHPSWVPDGGHHEGCFDNKSNPANKEEYQGYLYDDGIEEAFKDTAYEEWSRLFTQMSAAGIKANYNRLMVTQDDMNLIGVMELLFKGRFIRLLREESDNISYWSKGYCGPLRLSGSSIEDVFAIGDRQKINRIREKNGGEAMLDWMRWSDSHRQKISDKTLEWLLANGISPSDMAWIKCRFSLEQAMNYIERQRKEQYKGNSVKQVIAQYEDYMSMCDKLHKDTTDEMVYRPRELKRRHDEAVAEIERLNAQLKADEYSKKFGEAEKVLGLIREKFEYVGDGFFIKVPEKIVDIVSEGNYLHHCAGATDRYFDRIKSHETYICFLRKVEEPDIPFYTIEVEPGGTIRQHRGMYDEEPELDLVKPFLREWQKEIRKRMSKKDHELAAVSKQKREENIAELKAKNNTRVLNGLMEDFMEAI